MLRVSILCLFISLPLVFCVSCNNQFDCFEVSAHPFYAQCLNHVCVCPTANGFSGNATVSNKCNCLPPSELVLNNLELYCLNVPAAAAEVYAQNLCDSYKAKVDQVYQYVVYPRNLGILTNQLTLTNLFSNDTVARISPVGQFNDFEGVIEYFYGLAVLPQNSVYKVVNRYSVCEDNKVMVRYDLWFNQSGNPASRVPFVNVTHFGRFNFDENGLINQTDVVFPNLGAGVDTIDDGTLIPLELAPGVVVQLTKPNYSIYGTCGILVQTCTGDNLQYNSFEDCVGFMLSIDYGTFDRAFSDTFVCRSVHALLTLLRPQIHCPHAGPTGGGICVTTPYEIFYTDDIY
jgi:hypothetical protein